MNDKPVASAEALKTFKHKVLSTREPQTIESGHWILKGYTGSEKRVSDACVERMLSLAASTPEKVPDMAALRSILSLIGAPEGPAQRPKMRGRDPSGAFSALFSWPETIDCPTPKEEPKKESVKIGRNDPCQCGSGKKSKKCCG